MARDSRRRQRPVGSGSSWGVRYAQGGGLTDAERAARERIRLQAVVRFEGGETNREVAAALRVSERSVVRVRGRGSGLVSMAGMACFKPGRRPRLIYAIREYQGRMDESKGFGWPDFSDLVVRARIQLKGPIVSAWDNVRLHLTAGMKEFIVANAEWLTVFRLPAYAPDVNPTEGIRAPVERDLGNLAAADLGEITRAVKRRLKGIRYRPDLVDGCIAATGLSLDG
ncbi:helix-turn-helix domain-containing protein [Streptomyces mirabilis]